MKRILLFGAGKSATSLIRYLIAVASARDWLLVVAESNLPLAESKIGSAPHASAVSIQVENEAEREALVREADIVISLLPPALHYLVAGSCLKYSKDLLTASYLDPAIKALETEIREKGLLFLCEMGLDPGIDHMSAMELIGEVKRSGGRILSFRSHTGGLVAPDSDDNPWHYKISWNPRNIVLAGTAGARYKEDGRIITRVYSELFERPGAVFIKGAGDLAWYPNRDSLSYIPIYGLEEADTFIRTTLRYPGFCRAWKSIVRAGLTDAEKPVRTAPGNDRHALREGPPQGLTFAEWSAPILPYVDEDNRAQFEFLGLFDGSAVAPGARTSADILQYLLETKLAMQPQDKDMIVMQHEIRYVMPDPLPGAGVVREIFSTLIVKGEDSLQTAMAKTVGLPLGIAAKLILEGKIRLTGLHIPILPEIYIPVLHELEEQGIRFDKTSIDA
jgi:saccharopine dehydrogenase-like NADP-dependent oxidoreductase